MKMKVEVLLVLLCAFDLYDGIDSIPYTIYGDGNKKIYLLDLYTCVEEFEEYCHQIPRFSVQAAAEVANNCTNLLPGYTIYTSALKTTRSIASGKVVIIAETIYNFYNTLRKLISQNSTISPIVLGSPHSFFNEYAVNIFGSKQNFAQVNFESVIGSGNNLPFYDIGPTEIMLNLVRLELIKKHGWKRVGTLSSVGTYSMIEEHLNTLLMERNITVISTGNLIISKEKESNGIWNIGQLTVLKEDDVRIILGFFSPTEIPLILCEGYEMGLVDDYHVWILPEMNLVDVRRAAKHYNACDVSAVLKNVLMIGNRYVTNGTTRYLKQVPITTSKLDSLLAKYYEAMPMYNNISVKDIPGYYLSALIFDTAWAVIMALNESIKLLADRNMSMEFVLSNEKDIPMVKPVILDVVNTSLSQVRFSGLSGPVDLSNNDIIRMVHVLQMTTNNSICPVEMFIVNKTQMAYMEICSQCCDYVWGNDPPSSEGLVYHAQLSTAWLYFINAAIAVFMFLALILIVLNILLRKNKNMKTSSLKINLLIIFGCTFVIWSSFLVFLTFNEGQYNRARFDPLCQVELFLHEFGHTSVHVFLLLKTWRLYRIQTNNLLKKKIKCVSNKAIYLMILMLLVPMVILFGFQSAYDPSKLTTESKTIEDRYPYSYIHYSVCKDIRYMRISLAAYRIILILCILWQAANVSRMKIKKLALEGDISIALLIVVVIVMAGLAGVRISLIAENLFSEATIMYIMTAVAFPIITIIILFLPKLYLILKEYKDKRRSEKSIQNSKILATSGMYSRQ